MRKIFVCFMLIVFCFGFAGCTSASSLPSINTSFSSIYFAIDCSDSGFETMTEQEEALIKNKIQTLAGKYIDDVKLRYYDVLDKMAVSGKITSSQKVLLKNHLTPYVGWNENSYIVEFRFYSALASRIFITSAEYSGAVNDHKTFSSTTTEKYSKIFSKTKNNIITESLEEYFNNGVEETINEYGNELNKKFKVPKYYYFFATQNPRLHAVGADEEVKLGNGKIFCFYSNENYEEPIFEFYIVQANQFAYYLIALAITFTFLAIYLAVIYFKKSKNDNDNENGEGVITIDIKDLDDVDEDK